MISSPWTVFVAALCVFVVKARAAKKLLVNGYRIEM
jgi:hypothetical protein